MDLKASGVGIVATRISVRFISEATCSTSRLTLATSTGKLWNKALAISGRLSGATVPDTVSVYSIITSQPWDLAEAST